MLVDVKLVVDRHTDLSKDAVAAMAMVGLTQVMIEQVKILKVSKADFLDRVRNVFDAAWEE